MNEIEHGICENCNCIMDKKDLIMHYIEYMCEDCKNAFDKGVFFADMNRESK